MVISAYFKQFTVWCNAPQRIKLEGKIWVMSPINQYFWMEVYFLPDDFVSEIKSENELFTNWMQVFLWNTCNK